MYKAQQPSHDAKSKDKKDGVKFSVWYEIQRKATRFFNITVSVHCAVCAAVHPSSRMGFSELRNDTGDI